MDSLHASSDAGAGGSSWRHSQRASLELLLHLVAVVRPADFESKGFKGFLRWRWCGVVWCGGLAWGNSALDRTLGRAGLNFVGGTIMIPRWASQWLRRMIKPTENAGGRWCYRAEGRRSNGMAHAVFVCGS